MDTVTVIRVVAAMIAVVLMATLITRRRRLATAKSVK
jgi:hypothetical protein